ncbi:Pentatricopeptide repeat-containing protein, chloroplastic [Vitis vinifera]|uniref:Pentatricopeptide repeat-containing protein, chloroplastic n=1 Tax=Vitis vinifera TaxID=29760 RepID=A0A438JZQ0_VITVI|nr:Pentatricopeptide repeat-containing protein, chloroplastic [Vitis vinifera]
MGSATLCTGVDVHFSIPHPSHTTKYPNLFSKSTKFSSNTFTIRCNSSSRSPPKPKPKPKPTSSDSEQTNHQNPSLSEQLKPLSKTILTRDHSGQTHLVSKPKSTWINPTKPKPSVLSLQRHKRHNYSYNPQIRDLKLFAKRSMSLSPLMRVWETVSAHWRELANEMISTGVELDNITYSTIITCAKRCNLFDKAVKWFERMYKTGLMPDEVTYSAILDVYAKLGKVEEMFGEAGDYDGIRYVLQEMKSLGVQPNLVVYNTLLEAMGKAGKPGLARSLLRKWWVPVLSQTPKR